VTDMFIDISATGAGGAVHYFPLKLHKTLSTRIIFHWEHSVSVTGPGAQSITGYRASPARRIMRGFYYRSSMQISLLYSSAKREEQIIIVSLRVYKYFNSIVG
jgi:hypothetical protein